MRLIAKSPRTFAWLGLCLAAWFASGLGCASDTAPAGPRGSAKAGGSQVVAVSPGGGNGGATGGEAGTGISPTPGPLASPGLARTLAGGTWKDGEIHEAEFNKPEGIAVDVAGNAYVADTGNNRIRLITAAGMVSTIAGDGNGAFKDGAGTAARFGGPRGIALNSAGVAYVADTENNRIRKIDKSGTVTTLAGDGTAGLADGPSAGARFSAPSGVAVDASGSVYVADTQNNRIRKIAATGQVTTLTDECDKPRGVAVNGAGNVFFIDAGNRVFKLSPSGQVTTLAGAVASGSEDGSGTAARFKAPSGIALDAAGNVYVADDGNRLARKITPSGTVTTGGSYNEMGGIAVDGSGFLYVTERDRGVVWKRSFADQTSFWAGKSRTYADGTGAAARFSRPVGLAVSGKGNVFVADMADNRIRQIATDGKVTTFAGDGVVGELDGTGAAARFDNPYGVAVDSAENVYVSDANGLQIRKISPAGKVSTLAGNLPGFADGPAQTARFASPHGISVEPNGSVLVADSFNFRIRRVSAAGDVTTIAGDGTPGFADGKAPTARFRNPMDVGFDGRGNVIVADTANHRIRKISSAGQVSTIAGDGVSGLVDGPAATARFASPEGVTLDALGAILVADTGNDRIRRISPEGVVTTLAGGSPPGFADGLLAGARFRSPVGIAVDPKGNIHVSDTGNRVIRVLQGL